LEQPPSWNDGAVDTFKIIFYLANGGLGLRDLQKIEEFRWGEEKIIGLAKTRDYAMNLCYVISILIILLERCMCQLQTVSAYPVSLRTSTGAVPLEFSGGLLFPDPLYSPPNPGYTRPTGLCRCPALLFCSSSSSSSTHHHREDGSS